MSFTDSQRVANKSRQHFWLHNSLQHILWPLLCTEKSQSPVLLLGKCIQAWRIWISYFQSGRPLLSSGGVCPRGSWGRAGIASKGPGESGGRGGLPKILEHFLSTWLFNSAEKKRTMFKGLIHFQRPKIWTFMLFCQSVTRQDSPNPTLTSLTTLSKKLYKNIPYT